MITAILPTHTVRLGGYCTKLISIQGFSIFGQSGKSQKFTSDHLKKNSFDDSSILVCETKCIV